MEWANDWEELGLPGPCHDLGHDHGHDHDLFRGEA
jgi:hypothetical protein